MVLSTRFLSHYQCKDQLLANGVWQMMTLVVTKYLSPTGICIGGAGFHVMCVGPPGGSWIETVGGGQEDEDVEKEEGRVKRRRDRKDIRPHLS